VSRKPETLDEFGRFTEPAILILISLADRPKHGYAITEDIDSLTGHRHGPGTLYGAMARLESRGFIKPMEPHTHRCTYKLTAAGMKALRARLAAIETVTRAAQERLAGA
jgi:DNA-binding PadR family transcriptional regulator